MISISNYVHHNIRPPSEVKRKPLESAESIVFFLENNMKGDLYHITRGITWFMAVLKAKTISRSALAKFSKCHIDTVSSVNMRIEAAGIFKIFRTFKKPNHYCTDFLNELCKIFGYCQQSSAFLFIKDKVNNLIYNQKEEKNDSLLDHNPKISKEAFEKMKDFLKREPVCPPVFCPFQIALKKLGNSSS